MKLKFNPKFGSSSPPPPPPPNDPNLSPIPNKETASMGKGMIALAVIFFLVMLTIFFQGKIEKQNNPNQNISSQTNASGKIEIHLQRNRAGHYVSPGKINGKQVTFLLDTGATTVAIPEKMRQKLALKRGREIYVSTANGSAKGYQTMISELKIGEIVLYDVRAILTPNLDDILLGMSALKQVEFSQQGDKLTIRQ